MQEERGWMLCLSIPCYICSSLSSSRGGTDPLLPGAFTDREILPFGFILVKSGLKISSKNILKVVSVPAIGAALNVREQENQLCMAACSGCPWIFSAILGVPFFRIKIGTVQRRLSSLEGNKSPRFELSFEGVRVPWFYVLQ